MEGTAMRIDEMPAGPEMDALVAEKVMGEPQPHDAPVEMGSISGVLTMFNNYPWKAWLPECLGLGKPWTWRPLPYSTDIAAAWKVVEKICGRYRFDLGWGGDEHPLWGCRILSEGYRRFQDEEWSSQADSAPLAICKAALLAVGVTEVP